MRFKGLRVREAPGLAAKVLDSLPAGTIVELGGSWGPIDVDRIAWYQVLYGEDLKAGYVAGGSGADRYLELLPPRCEGGEPDLATLLRLTDWERVACYGDRS
ncbi:MAG: SH3 domain-containing protein, partial [Candidatus Limnocylindria bacterium]